MTDTAVSSAEKPAAGLYRRIALRLIPFLLLCYVVAMIDRLNVGFAKLQFMETLHFSETVYGTAAGILYVGYILFEVPSNLMLDRHGIRRTLLRIMVAWGVVSMALAFATSALGFTVLRFLLGAAEAGFFPGIILYVTYWFPARYRGRAISVFAAGVPISGLVAGPLSGWIMTTCAGLGGLAGWQWLFLVEGLPAVILGVAAFVYLADRPASAAFLTAAEKAQIAADTRVEAVAGEAKPLERFSDAARNPKIYLFGFVWFTFYSMQSVLLIWVPTLLRGVGVQSLVEIGWRAGAISLAGTIGMVAIGVSSDRSGDRLWHLVGCGLAASAAFLLLPLAASSVAGTTALLALAAVFVFGFLGLFWTVPSALLDKRGAAGGIALISALGSSGSAISPIFIGWVKDASGSLYVAISVLASLLILGMAVLYLCTPRARPALDPAGARAS